MASQELPDIKSASPGRWAVRADLDDALLGASLMFAGAAVWSSAVAIRDQLPGQPLGITIPLSVPAGLVAGWGREWPHRGRCRSRPSPQRRLPDTAHRARGQVLSA
jgi:hypothetical protein